MQFWTQDGIFELISPDRRSSVSVVFGEESLEIASRQAKEVNNVSSVRQQTESSPDEAIPSLFEYSADLILSEPDAG